MASLAHRARTRGGLAILLLLATACRRGTSHDSPDAVASAATKAARTSDGPPRDRAVIDFLDERGSCTFGHRGVLVDLGDPAAEARLTGASLARPDLEVREREGASWVGVRSRSLTISFVSTEEVRPEAGLVLEARARGGAAKSASLTLNGRPFGTLALSKGETRVVAVRAPQAAIQRGANELSLRFHGGPRAHRDELAELDWIRIGASDGDTPYAAPTRSDAVTTVSLGSTPRRAISLRAPGFARCSGFVPSGSMLEGLVGTTGGEADAEVRLIVDRAEPRIVGTIHLGGPGPAQGWRPLSLPLGDVDTIAAIELVVRTGSKGARVAFAEPRVVAPAVTPRATDAPPKARGVILVVLGSMSRRISLYGGPVAMPELSKLAEAGVTFDAHRATSSFASGSVGSMLTGISPRAHGAADPDAPLSRDAATIAEAARHAGVVTAMFTANPTTTSPFGFDRGWETFVPLLPGEGAQATTVFDEAGKWLDAHKRDRFFLVVHARGGHPPWDITADELRELPPQGYQGSLEPKNAGEALAKARRSDSPPLRDADRERAFALYSKALFSHDAALGALAARVKTLGRDQDTAWIVTSDVGVNAAARVPLLEEDSLEEGALATPLVVRAPGARQGARITTGTSSVDVARTVLDALGLPPPRKLEGESLLALTGAADERPRFATTATRFSVRWGPFAVVGAKDREVRLCNLTLDPECVTDVRATHPLAAEALHDLAWSALGRSERRPKVERASPEASPAHADASMTAALRVWGR